MTESNTKFGLFPYDGGLDRTKHPALLDPKDVVEMNNIIYTTYNTKKLRPGITQLFKEKSPPVGGNIKNIIDYWRSGVQYFVYFDGKRLRWYKPSDGTFGVLGEGLDLNVANVNFITFQGLLIIFFGKTSLKPHYWIGSGGLTEITEASAGCPFGQIWLNSLWVTDPSVPGRIQKSATGAPLDFTTPGDALDFDIDISDDPFGVTAIFPPFFNSLYVAKRMSLYRIDVQFDSVGSGFVFSQNKISDGIGCISHNAVSAVEDFIFFPSDRGIHILSQSDKISGVETQFLTKDVQPLWRESVNFSRTQEMQSVYDVTRNCYLLIFSTPGNDTPDMCWGYSLYTGKWFVWEQYNQSSIFRYFDFVSNLVRIGVTSRNNEFGFIDDAVFTDYGKKYGAFLSSGIIIPSGQPRMAFQLSKITPYFVPQSGGKFFVVYKINGVVVDRIEFDQIQSVGGSVLGEDFIMGSSVLGGIPQIAGESINTKGYGEFFQFSIEYKPSLDGDEESSSAGFEVLGIVMDLIPVSGTTGKTVG